MANESGGWSNLLQRAAGGDESALMDLFSRYRTRLKRMVHLRLSRRLQGRVDDSDILQESFLVVSQRLKEYVEKPPMPLFLWLRQITGQKLVEFHRRHLGAQMRDADREVSLHRGGLPEAGRPFSVATGSQSWVVGMANKIGITFAITPFSGAGAVPWCGSGATFDLQSEPYPRKQYLPVVDSWGHKTISIGGGQKWCWPAAR